MFKKAHTININELLKDEHIKLNYEYNVYKGIQTAKGIKNKLYEAKAAVKDTFERSKYGVSAHDAWSLGDYILVSISNGLRILARDAHGWPGTKEFPKFEDWQMKLLEVAEDLDSTTSEYVDKIADKEWHKYVVTKNVYGADSEEAEKAHDEWVDKLTQEQEEIKKTRKKAFKWIAEHCDQLWD